MVSDLVQRRAELRESGLNPCSNGIWSLTEGSTRGRSRRPGLNPCSNGIWSLTMGSYSPHCGGFFVLILVLMEYGLWPYSLADRRREEEVLILVLMEYGLWRLAVLHFDGWGPCLNPCSNGIWSLTVKFFNFINCGYVLILVLMEYGLWPKDFLGEHCAPLSS